MACKLNQNHFLFLLTPKWWNIFFFVFAFSYFLICWFEMNGTLKECFSEINEILINHRNAYFDWNEADWKNVLPDEQYDRIYEY